MPVNRISSLVTKRILLTGMSGTGKSTAIDALAARGYTALDLDEPGWSQTTTDGDWQWREDEVEALLSRTDGEFLFVSGCSENQGRFYPRFDAVILLSAPTPLIVERLRTRTNNPYGKHPQELADVLRYLETVEPLLRRSATHEIDTSQSLDDVVGAVLRIAGLVPS
jgi:dephospho-CoA kinase